MAKALANLRESYAPERLAAEIDKVIAVVDNIVDPAWPHAGRRVCANARI